MDCFGIFVTQVQFLLFQLLKSCVKQHNAKINASFVHESQTNFPLSLRVMRKSGKLECSRFLSKISDTDDWLSDLIYKEQNTVTSSSLTRSWQEKTYFSRKITSCRDFNQCCTEDCSCFARNSLWKSLFAGTS